MQLDISKESIYRQHYKNLESLLYCIRYEMNAYEAGEAMTGTATHAACSEVIRSGAKVELVTDWINE